VSNQGLKMKSGNIGIILSLVLVIGLIILRRDCRQEHARIE